MIGTLAVTAASVGRIRRLVVSRVRALQARYDAPTIGRLSGLRTQLGDLQAQLGQVQAQLVDLEAQLAEMGTHLGDVPTAVDAIRHVQAAQVQVSRAAYDDLGTLRDKLVAVRASPGYAAVFEHSEPIISVPIATYNAAELLVERAVASVLAQSYTRWEMVVVGDGCTDDTAARIEALGDPRIRFVNLPFRTIYPDGERERWMVSGAAPWNRAVELCRGAWIAPLDDDDEFLPHHMETLLALALDRRAEFVYGKLEAVGHSQPFYFSFPPVFGGVGMQASLYLRALDFFECDVRSWVIDEPTDWNVVRRMRDAGVLMAATEETVARYYPSYMKWR